MEMTKKRLAKANELDKKIKELKYFISEAERVRNGKIIKQDTKYIFKPGSPWGFSSIEYVMDRPIYNEMLDVLRRHLEELEEEFLKI